MKHTTNLALNLPDLADKFSIAHANDNMTAIDTKFKQTDTKFTEVQAALNQRISEATTSLSAAMTASENSIKTQLDIIRYNEYIQFVREHYISTPYKALGYFCDIFRDYNNVESLFPDNGILINSSSLKMGDSYEMGTLGTSATNHVTMTHFSHQLTFRIPGPSETLTQYTGISLHYSLYSRYGHMVIRPPQGGQDNFTLNLEQSQSGFCNVFTYAQYTSGYASIRIHPESGESQYNVAVAIDENAGGTCACNGIEYRGQPVGTFGRKIHSPLTTTYRTKSQQANMPFDKATLFIRYTTPAGTSIAPKISVNGGSQWRPFVFESTKDTVNHSGVICKEGRYQISDLPRGTSFKLQIEMKRNGVALSPIVYDYCMLYGEE